MLDLALSRAPVNEVGTRLVCIDGLAGAGKTTLAEAVRAETDARGVGCAVVHMDDLYPGWRGLAEGSQTVWRDVVVPLTQGRAGQFRRYDWHRAAFEDALTVPVSPVVVIEGCGSAPPPVAAAGALVVYVTAPEEVRLARGLARDGEAMRAEWVAFMADERALEERHRTRERADVVIDEVGTVLRWPRV